MISKDLLEEAGDRGAKRQAEKIEWFNGGYRAGLRKAIEMMGTDKEPLKPWLTPADCAGIRNIYRTQLREALEAELEKKK